VGDCSGIEHGRSINDSRGVDCGGGFINSRGAKHTGGVDDRGCLGNNRSFYNSGSFENR